MSVFAHVSAMDAMHRSSLIFGVFLMLACGSATELESPRVEITAEITQAALEPGERVLIRVRISNLGTRPVALRGPSACAPFYQVMQGEVEVAPLIVACAANLPNPRWLGPGEMTNEEYPWSGDAPAGQVPSNRPLVPGEYKLRGIVRAEDILVTSQSIPVRITPPR